MAAGSMTWTEVADRLAEARSAMAWRLDDYDASQRRWPALG